MTTPLSGITWPSKTVTWAFAKTGPIPALGRTVTAAVTDPGERAAVTAGVNEWAEVSGVRLAEIDDPVDADVLIGFGEPKGLLGECTWFYNPQTDMFRKALVLLRHPGYFDKSGDGALTYPGQAASLQQLTAHEFGAALGLAEGSGADKRSVMNHVQDGANPVPDTADVAAIDRLFGPVDETHPAYVPGTPDRLVLVLSEDAWRGDAAFTVSVNGETRNGPTMVTASNCVGATQHFTYEGRWGNGPVSVEITFVNDSYGGAPDKDRNLYIWQVIYNGIEELTKARALFSDGSITVTVGG